MNSDLKYLDDIDHIKGIDESDMLSKLVTFGQQCKEAIEVGELTTPFLDRKSVSHIVVSGLGGSAIGGDLLRTCLVDDMNIPVLVNRDYSLPSYVSTSSFLFLVSYSGNTEEVLSVFEVAVERNVPLVCITSGGLLFERAMEKKKHVISIPPGYPPRTALGYLFFPMLIVLSNSGLLENKEPEISETITLLKKKAEEYHPKIPIGENMAKQLAARLCDFLPLLYASEGLYPVARRWGTQIAENSESFAHSNVFPELNHNEIMSWHRLSQFASTFSAVFLRDKGDSQQVKRRMEESRKLLESDDLSVVEAWSEGDSLLTRLFSLICLGDFVSFYLAILRGIDPTPVERIEYLKAQLRERTV